LLGAHKRKRPLAEPFVFVSRSVAVATAAKAAAATTAATATVGATETAATAAFATTTKAAATFTATTETTTAWGTGFHGASFVHHQVAATQRGAVHASDGSLRFGIAAHFYKTKTF
jgi:hypothetical protein